MAFGTNKAQHMREGAAEHIRGGAVIFLPEFLALSRSHWAEYVAVIEREGWKLEHWTIAPSGSAMPVFRRVQNIPNRTSVSIP